MTKDERAIWLTAWVTGFERRHDPNAGFDFADLAVQKYRERARSRLPVSQDAADSLAVSALERFADPATALSLLRAAYAWKLQGARTKWSTPESLALWDALESLVATP